jgi:hypothetical protein
MMQLVVFVHPLEIENKIILLMIDLRLFVEVNQLEEVLKSVAIHLLSCICSDRLNYDHYNRLKDVPSGEDHDELAMLLHPSMTILEYFEKVLMTVMPLVFMKFE